MLEQLLTPEFWKSASQTLSQCAPLVVPLVLLSGYIGWLLRKIVDDGQIKGLKAQLSARDERLQLAREKENEVTAKLAVAQTEGQALQGVFLKFAKHDNALATIETSVVRTNSAIQQASASTEALRRTLKVDQPQITYSSE